MAASHTPPGRTRKDRVERLELRMNAEEKDIIGRASAAGGDDAAVFVRRAALVEARRVLGLLAGDLTPEK